MADALETIRRAMALHETVATTEQKKGDAADLRLMADAMSRAADLASQIAQIEDRRGITAPVSNEPVEVMIVRSIMCPKCKTEHVAPGRQTLDEVVASQRARANAPKLSAYDPKRTSELPRNC